MYRRTTQWGALAAVVFCSFGCGEEGKPRPGSAALCETPLAGVLGCGAKSDPFLSASGSPETEACSKLVSCGILAAEHFTGSGTDCQTHADCDTGECLPNHEGALKCHYHRLDLFWCVQRMAHRRMNRCDNEDPFTTEEVDAVLACIARTPCAALGLPFEMKTRGAETPALDAFVCNEEETKVFAATVCDHGLLEYR